MEHRGNVLRRKLTRARRIRSRAPDTARWLRRGRLIYLFLIPLFVSVVFALLRGHYSAFIQNMLGFVMLLGSATATARGLAQEAAYRESIITRAPRVPYKTFAMVLLGLSVSYLAYVSGGKPLATALFVGILGSVGYSLYYGLDPRKDKLAEMGDINPELVLQTLNDAQKKLTEAEADTAHITDKVLRRKLESAIDNAHRILDTIRHDPKDLRVARKFLVVFVDGIADVTRTYNDVDEADIDAVMRDRLHRLIDDVQTRFDKERARLKANNLFDLDVTIDTLKAQVNH